MNPVGLCMQVYLSMELWRNDSTICGAGFEEKPGAFGVKFDNCVYYYSITLLMGCVLSMGFGAWLLLMTPC